jgi:hypothetical protein
MIDPNFWDDNKIKLLSVTERLLFIGMISYADDEGRLLANPAYLRSKIFPYDDFSLVDIKTMRDNIIDINKNVLLYDNGGEEYLSLSKWKEYQKPSHPQPSRIPAPPKLQEQISEPFKEPFNDSIPSENGMIPSQVRSGQSSLGKVSIGQDRAVQEEFTKFLDNDIELTDRLTMTLKDYLPAAPAKAMDIVKQLWRQVSMVELEGMAFDVVWSEIKKCPVTLFANCVVKSARYSKGKIKPYRYIQKVFEEQKEKYEKERSP